MNTRTRASGLLLPLAAAVVVAASACREGAIPLTPTPLALEPDSATLLVGQSLHILVATPSDARAGVLLRSSAADVASVDSSGAVLARAPGHAIIRASWSAQGEVVDSVVVTVMSCASCRPYTPALLVITDTTGVVQDPARLHGTILVRLDLEVPGPDTLRLDVRLDDVALCSSAAPPGPRTTACRIDTEEFAGGLRRFPAGPHVLTTQLARSSGTVLASASQAVIFESLAPATISAPLVAISTSGAHSCAVAQDGVTYCWGDGRDGQLGLGGRSSSLVPARVGGPALVAISTGAGIGFPEYPTTDQPYWSATCGRAPDGTGYCWGQYFAVGAGDYPCAECSIPLIGTPHQVFGGLRFRSIVVDPYGQQSCGISTEPEAYCWGARPERWAIPESMQGTRAWASTLGGACALTAAGAVLCHGTNRFGQAGAPWTDSGQSFGTGDSVAATTVPVPGGVALDTLVASIGHVCGLSAAGDGWCWGRNDRGQLGAGTMDTLCVTWANTHACPEQPAGPRHVLVPRKLVRISAGLLHSCALADDGSAWCWGRNVEGQLGSPGGDTATPRAVATALRFRELSAGGRSTCAIATDGRAWCWGDNGWGQLGTGDKNRRALPARVAGQRE